MEDPRTLDIRCAWLPEQRFSWPNTATTEEFLLAMRERLNIPQFHQLKYVPG
jgi:hypothetical protein